MNVLSLFNGISVANVALNKAGIKVDNFYSSEIDKHAIEVTQKNFPNTIQLGNVENFKEWNLPKIDLILGGSPCQGFSRQGKGLNFEDPRSKLFFTFIEVLKHFKPKYFLLENVEMKKDWENVITENMGVEPIHINSSLFVPQNRPRVYWTNISIGELKQRETSLNDVLEDVRLEDYVLKDNIKISKKFSDNSINLIEVVDKEVRVKQAVKKGYAIAQAGDGINISFPMSKSRRGRVIKGRSSCLDTSCNIGVYDFNDQIRRFTVTELERLQGLPDGYTSGIPERERIKCLGNGWTVDVITHILSFIKEDKK